ncbi:hypothetical protein OROGR_031753 [Orobanche gracilis]
MAANNKVTNLLFIFISLALSPNIILQVDAADVSDEWCGRTYRKADCLSIVMADKRANLKTSPNGLATILRDRAVATAVDTSLKIATFLKKAIDKREVTTLRSCSADYFDAIDTLTTADFKVMDHKTYPTLVAVIDVGNDKARDCEFSFRDPRSPIRSPISAENERLREICAITLQIINLVVCNSVSSC